MSSWGSATRSSIRWGILGCGNVCEVKSGPAFQKAEGSELVAVMRRDRLGAQEFARRHGVPAFYDDAAKLIADPRVDAVYVASPPGSHLELALQVAASGKPAYVEKPMARTYAECLRMLEAFDLAGAAKASSASRPLATGWWSFRLGRARALLPCPTRRIFSSPSFKLAREPQKPKSWLIRRRSA